VKLELEGRLVDVVRALMAAPRLIMVDEMSLGLAPVVVDQLLDIMTQIRGQGVTVLLVEQDVHAALSIADRDYVLETGEIVREGTQKNCATIRVCKGLPWTLIRRGHDGLARPTTVNRKVFQGVRTGPHRAQRALIARIIPCVPAREHALMDRRMVAAKEALQAAKRTTRPGRVPSRHPRRAARALGALLLILWATAWPTCAEDAKDTKQPLTAILLVARPDLRDPNFQDSVVLVMNNLGSAPIGFIINRPTRVGVSHLFPDVERLAHLDDKLYFGGPVALESVSFLVRADTPPEHAIQVVDGVYLSTDRELLGKLLERDKPMEGLRIFVGYSGWGPGQLEAEIARGDWTPARAEPGSVFEHRAEHPWPDVPPEGVGPRI
jgi:putative transcriptional regulator